MKKLFLFLLGFLLLFFVAYLCVHKYIAPAIEADIKHKAERSLVRNDFSSVQVVTDGRDITLTGVVSSESLKAKAARVAAVEGYHLIDNQVMVVLEQSANTSTGIAPYTLLLGLKENQSVVLSGSVASAKMKTALLSLANSRYGKANVSDDLSIKGKAPDNWQAMAVVAINSFSRLRQGKITLSNQDFLLTGVVDSSESRQHLGEYLENNLPKQVSGKLNIAIGSANEDGEAVEASKNDVAKRCQKRFNAILLQNKILFETDGSVIAKSSLQVLDELVLVAMGCSKRIIIISGHTDATGADINNKKLSLKRAEAVVSYLSEKGIGKKNLKAMGYGEEKPVAPNNTSKGRALNRRIEFTVEEMK